MRKILFVTSLLLGLTVSSQAAIASDTQTITINGRTVEKTAVELAFDGDNVVLHFSDGTEQAADMESVAIAFDNATTGIDQVKAFNLAGTTDGNIHLSGVQCGERIEVFDVSGKKVAQTKASSDSASLDITNMKSGVYVLRTGNTVIKFVKR